MAGGSRRKNSEIVWLGMRDYSTNQVQPRTHTTNRKHDENSEKRHNFRQRHFALYRYILMGFAKPTMPQGTSHDCCCWWFLESLLLLLLLLVLRFVVVVVVG